MFWSVWQLIETHTETQKHNINMDSMSPTSNEIQYSQKREGHFNNISKK